jgi:uncharacterized protein YhfF
VIAIGELSPAIREASASMSDDARIEEFWAAFLRSQAGKLPADLRYYEAEPFGNTAEMADELAALVEAGVKTATSGLFWGYEAEGLSLPVPGDYTVVLDSTGAPRCVTETVELRVIPFDEVDEPFAHEYGEGDRTLAWWREHLWDYYVAECAEHGWQPRPEMPLVCERFRVVYPPPLPTSSHQG